MVIFYTLISATAHFLKESRFQQGERRRVKKVISPPKLGRSTPRNEGVVNMILTNAIIHTGTESRTDTVYMTALSK